MFVLDFSREKTKQKYLMENWNHSSQSLESKYRIYYKEKKKSKIILKTFPQTSNALW